MKRCWFGLVLLLLLLALGIGSSVYMDRHHQPIADALDRAAAMALAGDWESAQALAGDARARWEEGWGTSASFSDHAPMEEMDGLFHELEIYATARDPVSYGAVCAQLSRTAHAMGEAHNWTWWNVL